MSEMLTQMIAYEQGELDEDEVIAFFQHLVDTGIAWQLQGSYGRTAMALIESGAVSRPDVHKLERVA
jgi:hypothetical protein